MLKRTRALLLSENTVSAHVCGERPVRRKQRCRLAASQSTKMTIQPMAAANAEGLQVRRQSKICVRLLSRKMIQKAFLMVSSVFLTDIMEVKGLFVNEILQKSYLSCIRCTLFSASS